MLPFPNLLERRAFRRKRLTRTLLWGSLITLATAGIVYACVTAGTRRRIENERAASAALKTLATAEADFRANDRDRNLIQDFWTGDVRSLYYMEIDGRPLKLIAKEVADADASPIDPNAPPPVPYRGYFFRAMHWDDSTAAEYRHDTDGRGAVHNTSQFGFCAYPAGFGRTGGISFILNENNTLFKRQSEGKAILHWPEDSELKNIWGGGGPD